MILGTDVSFYQSMVEAGKPPRYIDFQKMKDAGAEFTIIRAGQNKWKDRDIAHNWQSAKGILPRGSYWFYDSRATPKSQAELWISALGGDLGELPLWCDFEDNYGGAWHGWKHWYDFIIHLQTLAPGKQIGIYTGYYYWNENTLQAGIPAVSLRWFSQFPLWVANYGVSSPLVPRPWESWTLWQYTDKGDGFAFGVHSRNIDMNHFNGTKQEMYDRFGIGTVERKTITARFGNQFVEYQEK